MRAKSAVLVGVMTGTFALGLVIAPPAHAGSFTVHGVTVTWDSAAMQWFPPGGCTHVPMTYTATATDVKSFVIRPDGTPGTSVQAPAASGALVLDICDNPSLEFFAGGPNIRLRLSVISLGAGGQTVVEEATGIATLLNSPMVQKPPPPRPTLTEYTICSKGSTAKRIFVGRCPTGWKWRGGSTISSLPGPPVIYSEKSRCVNDKSVKIGKPRSRTFVGVGCPPGWTIDYFVPNRDYFVTFQALAAASY